MRPEPIRLFASDLDGTLLGNPDAAARFGIAWDALELSRRPLLVYNTGRSVADTRAVVAARSLPEADYVIGSLGTEFHGARARFGREFPARFGPAWNLARVEQIVSSFPGPRRQPAEFLHPFKSSWFWVRALHNDLEMLRRQLRAAGIEAHVDYSCRYFLDVVPACAGKGNALEWLCRQLSLPLARVLVAGDTGNDASMFFLPEVRGIVVGNALPELRAGVIRRHVFVSAREMADGVLEGLAHFAVIAPEISSAASDGTRCALAKPPV